MALTLEMVTVDCADPEALATWWVGAVGGTLEVVAPGEFVVLAIEGGPDIGFQKVSKPTPGKNRLHLDLRAADKEAEVARLVAAGATELARNAFGTEFRWVVLADPDGNQFCILGE